ncbi:MAG TPA: hypothetical protein PKY77_07140 [Phycisphaerae bacterium]|nr:hypothetical protein [Phycisphaerae bacterium]HRY67777.1 hypothetical protein [Phycisphaerae bacterium]HSA25229.1 hypothetical protein [Phycisphaerae bacterium]
MNLELHPGLLLSRLPPIISATSIIGYPDGTLKDAGRLVSAAPLGEDLARVLMQLHG